MWKAEKMKESLAEDIYDLVRAEPFVPFSIHFASGQRFEIKSRDHIGLPDCPVGFRKTGNR
jgi:hypothetical protein